MNHDSSYFYGYCEYISPLAKFQLRITLLHWYRLKGQKCMQKIDETYCSHATSLTRTFVSDSQSIRLVLWTADHVRRHLIKTPMSIFYRYH